MGVGYCLFDTDFPEPLPDKRKMLHTFFFINHIRGAGWKTYLSYDVSMPRRCHI